MGDGGSVMDSYMRSVAKTLNTVIEEAAAKAEDLGLLWLCGIGYRVAFEERDGAWVTVIEAWPDLDVPAGQMMERPPPAYTRPARVDTAADVGGEV